VWACDTSCDWGKERLYYFDKLCRFNNVHDLFHFVEKYDLFGAVDLWPETKKPPDNLANE